MPTLARINIHPVKSFDAQSVAQAVLLTSGALEHDRRFALRDLQGNVINGKRTAAVHHVRSQFDAQTGYMTQQVAGDDRPRVFHVDRQRAEWAEWLGKYFGMPLEIVENAGAGFPDDTDSPGPTLISVATMAEISRWYPGLTIEQVRGRFRANLEIEGVEPFWEDRLVAEGTQVVRFRVGQVELLGTNPCQRCIVPTRDPLTGERTYDFSKRFSKRREETLPAWAASSRFDHFYRLAVNTRPAEAVPRTLHVGDEVQILGVE